MNLLPVTSPEEWHKLRAQHIGASEVAALFGCEPSYAQSKFALWQVKSGKIPAPVVDGKRIQAGKRLESAIAHWIADINEWKIEQWQGYASSGSTRGIGCTPDFRILGQPEGDGLLEVKSVDWLMHKRTWVDGEPPMHIQLQLQHQLHVTEMKWGVVGALVGGNEPMCYRFEYRPKVGAEIERRVREFWDSVEAKQEPAADGSDTTGAALAALFPEAVPGKTAEMDGDNEFPERWATLIQAKADRKAAETAEQASKNWLMAKISDAELIRFGGAIVATAKTQTRKGYTVKESSSRVLRIKEN